MFTVEQVELLRRLRNSGLTKTQVCLAWDSLERLDRELGGVYNTPAATHVTKPLTNGSGPLTVRQIINGQKAAAAAAGLTAAEEVSKPVVTSHAVTSPAEAAVERKRSIEEIAAGLAAAADLKDTVTLIQQTTLQQTPLSSRKLVDLSDRLPQIPPERMRDFQAQGERACCDEIRSFVLAYSIKQTQIAQLAGISQSYVSRYLKGDFADMSERSKQSIYRWYMAFRDCPAAIPSVLTSPSAVGFKTDAQGNITAENNTQEPTANTPVPRRERFVFRPCHLQLLEKSFLEDTYPSLEKREEIASLCNQALEAQGRLLSDKEKVSAQIISNWFANKRKDMKKLAREEGYDPGQFQLRGKGRPARLPGLQAHSADPLLGPGLPLEGLVALQERRACAGDLESLSTEIETTPNLEPMEDRVESMLEQVVEFAAVNQAIMSLSGQTPVCTLKTDLHTKPSHNESPPGDDVTPQSRDVTNGDLHNEENHAE